MIKALYLISLKKSGIVEISYFYINKNYFYTIKLRFEHYEQNNHGKNILQIINF